VTLPPEPYSETSSPPDAPGTTSSTGATTPARQVTEPMRQLAATTLLVGNGAFLFVGLSDLIFVVDSWASEFGARSAATFDAFAGPLAVVLPLLAVLIATHIAPTVPQARGIVLAALGSYGFSALFGVITYLGAFAGDLFSVRATFDGLLVRAVWLAFLTIAGMAVYKIYRATYPPGPVRTGYAYGPTVYGRPYPGQPMYPQPTYKPGTAEPNYEQKYEASTFDGPTAETGWPVVPPQPASSPTPVSDPTVRMAAPPAAPGEATRLMRPVAPPPAAPASPEPGTNAQQ
jgi:hypothetical protein